MIPVDLILQTDKVILRPVEEKDFDTFLQLAKQDEAMWEYFSLNLADEKQLDKWMELVFRDREAGTRNAFTIIEKATGLIAGSSSMGNISYGDLRLEIGWSWLGKDFRSTGINRHAKFTMMNHAFEEQHFERVEFKTGVLNDRARKGLVNVGGIEEGTLRSHSALWGNRRRTSVMYSVLKNEWPALKQTIFNNILIA